MVSNGTITTWRGGACGRFAGVRFLGEHDWYRLGAGELVQRQDKLSGYWQGVLNETDKVLATSFALLFLANGHAPVLIHKLQHAPGNDWDNDANDVSNLVSIVSPIGRLKFLADPGP